MKYEVKQDTGYGLIPKSIMRDKNLSISAKAIYSYLASFAGNTGQAFPSVSLIIGELNISKDTFYKYMEELKVTGAIEIKKVRSKGQFTRNIYLLNNQINPPCPKSSDTVEPDTVEPDTVEPDTISNSLKSNSLKSNSSSGDDNFLIDEDFKNLINLFVNSGFGSNIAYIRDEMNGLLEDYEANWIEDAMKEAIDNNVRKLSYVKGILRDWDTKGKNNRQYKQEVEKRTNSWQVDAT